MPPKKTNPELKATRTIPHNLEAEQSVLGCVLYDAETAAEILPQLTAADFYSESHKYIYEAMHKIYHAGRPVDLVTLADELETNGTLSRAGGLPYITTVIAAVPSAANFKHYVDIVRRDSIMRRLVRAANDIIEAAHSPVSETEALSLAEKSVFDIGRTADSSQITPINESVTEVMHKFQQISQNKNVFRGLPTGFNALDGLLQGGLHKSDLVLIAARPAMGKSSFAMNMVENAALQSGAVCAVFSLEMPKVQIAQRMVCSTARVPMSKALSGKLDERDWERVWKANKALGETKIFVDDSSLITPAEILSKCRRLKSRYGLDLIMIDYIQLMSGSKRADNRQQEISEISRSLKIIAKEIDVPVLALSQLSRAVESRSSHRPQLSDLRESGAIEQDADIVMFIYRADRVEANQQKVAAGDIQKDVVEILVEKHRNGATGSVFLGWTGEYVKFENTDRRADELLNAYGAPPAPGDPGSGIPAKTSAQSLAPPPDEEFVPPPDDLAPPPDAFSARFEPSAAAAKDMPEVAAAVAGARAKGADSSDTDTDSDDDLPWE